MRLFGRRGPRGGGLSGQIARAWQDPRFHHQHPLMAALLEGLFPHLCPCTKVIPGHGAPTVVRREGPGAEAAGWGAGGRPATGYGPGPHPQK